MLGWSLPAGRYFGVEVRLHASFLWLLAVGLGAAAVTGVSGARVLALWLLLLFAVAVQEIARALAAAWLGLDLRQVLLLPTGGLLAFRADASDHASAETAGKKMALAGAASNLILAALLAGLSLGAAPGISLLAQPLLSPLHLLRAAVWINVLMGVLHLLPALPLGNARRLLAGKRDAASATPHSQQESPESGPPALGGAGRQRPLPGGAAPGLLGAGSLGLFSARASLRGIGQFVALALIVLGLALPNLWLLLLGPLVLVYVQLVQGQSGQAAQAVMDTVRMRDVMLTQFTTIPASDTLEDALQRAVHTLQDVFPVVRGDALVGAVSRQSLLEALAQQGNSYVQGVMTKRLDTAQPDDSLVTTLRRILGGPGAQLVPVMVGERIVGIVTPQNLSQSMGLLDQSRRLRRAAH